MFRVVFVSTNQSVDIDAGLQAPITWPDNVVVGLWRRANAVGKLALVQGQVSPHPLYSVYDFGIFLRLHDETI